MPPRVRKRNRKRKRRNVSSSSSSSSSASSEDSSPPPSKAPLPVIADGSDSDGSSSLSSSSASSTPTRGTTPNKLGPLQQTLPRPHPSRSPSPPDTALPALIPTNPIATETEKEKALKEKFRKFWMASIADGFKDDLEQIRKEPNMTKSRLSVLIDALASGADVFSSVTQSGSRNQINEMEVVLGSSSS